MNIIQRIRRRKRKALDTIYTWHETKSLRKQIQCRTEANRVFIFCSSDHSNLGDQAQRMCWLKLLKEWYPTYEVVCVPIQFVYPLILRDIHKTIKTEDLIFVHSGYMISDLTPVLPFMMEVIASFFDKPITILPQTVHITDLWYRQVVARVFNAHPNLTLLCRDNVSFANAQKLFPNVTLKLYPDVVTSLIGDKNFQYDESKRNGVMFCVRNDGEKLYTTEQINELRHRFKSCRTTIDDTTIPVQMKEWRKHREKLIRRVLKTFSQYQVIITDRYHGVIFSQVVNTPVIVIDSTDHKLRSGVDWFPKDKFGDNIFYVKNLDDAYERAMSILERNGETIKNPSWFKDNYYSKKL